MKNILAEVYKGNVSFSENVRWIGASGTENWTWYIARREFTANSAEQNLLTVCAPHYAEAYINGVLAARFCERSYLFDVAYKTVDISGFVNDGKNTLVIIFPKNSHGKSLFAAQISAGDKVLLVSDEKFKLSEYLPLSPKTCFFIIGGQLPEVFDERKNSFSPAFRTGFDDSAWENASVAGKITEVSPYEAMHQEKNDMQTSYPVFAKSFVSLEKSRDEDGIFVSISLCAGKTLLCETCISSENDIEISIDSFGGVSAMSFDGKIIPFGEKIIASAGKHRLAVAGSAPNIFVKGKDFSMSEWLKTEVDIIIPEKAVPRFPWNDIAALAKMPKETKEYLEISAYPVSEEQTAVIFASEPTLFQKLSERKYIKCADSITDARLEAVSPREVCSEPMGVLNKESIFFEDGEMTVKASEKDVTFILDFGVEVIGGVFLDVTAAEGAEITMNAFEIINDKGAVFGNDHQIMKYICKEGRKEYVSHVRRGFRYLLVNITSPNADMTISKIGLLEWRYPAEDVAKFECSDKRLNEIYKMCLDTVKVCMLDAYVDCPGYEQNIWTGDAKITALVNLCAMGEYDFNSSYLKLISRSVEDGLRKVYRTRSKRYIAGNFLSCACFPTYPDGTIPIWSYMWSLAVIDHYLYTGDKETLISTMSGVEANMDRSLKMLTERGLFAMNGAWSLIEWGNNDICEYGEITANNIMLSYCLQEFSKIEELLGNKALAEKYAAYAESIDNAVNKYCWNDERGAYMDMVRDKAAYADYLKYYEEIGKTPLSFEEYMSLSRISVQTNTFAVLYGIAKGERREKALKILADNIESGVYISGSPSYRTIGEPSEKEAPGGIVHVGSPFFMYFVLKTLFENGYSELALRSIKREWGDMLDTGVTTCTESFNSKTEWKTRSVAHAWSASPAIYLLTELLGVRPIKPGFEEFEIVPCRSDVDYAKGSMPTPYGNIYVEWHRDENGNLDISHTAPKECVRIR